MSGTMSPGFSTVMESLETHASRCPDKLAFRIVDRHANETDLITYGELAKRAACLSSHLSSVSEPGARIILALPTGLDFITCLFGCFLSGRIAVPCAFPNFGSTDAFEALLADCRPSAIVTHELHAPAVTALAAGKGIVVLAVDDLTGCIPIEAVLSEPNAPALLQYTSGSTRRPRGVIVTHRNITANSRMIRDMFGHNEDSNFVSWLPLFHDMGLIGSVIQPVMLGAASTLISPTHFSYRPRVWLEAITRYRAHTSGGPDSAYRLCVQAVGSEDISDLDLSQWAVAYNGAEPVRAETLLSFAERFSAAGFRADSFLLCYGLAEATLLVAGSRFDGARSMRIVPVDHSSQGSTRLGLHAHSLAIGAAAEGLELVIVDPATNAPVAPGQIGEIRVAGDSVSLGYWNDDDATRGTFSGDSPQLSGFLRTGDLGRLEGVTLHITGQIKDIIIVDGRNIFPEDIEATAESFALGRACRAAAVSFDRLGSEGIAIVVEVARALSKATLGHMADAMWAKFETRHRIVPDKIIFVRRGTLPRTTSGKIRRSTVRDRVASGQIVSLASFPDATDETTLQYPIIQRAIAETVVGFLAVDAIDPAVPFAAVGLDSLAAMRLRNRLVGQFGSRLPPTHELLGLSTRGLARRIANAAPPAPVVEATAEDLVPPIMLTHATATDPSALNLTLLVTADHEVSGVNFVRSLEAVVRRRPHFAATPGGSGAPFLGDAPCSGWAVRRISCAAGDVAAAVAVESRRPFNAGAEAPMRAILFEPEESKRTLLIIAHHSVADLWAMALLASELVEAYANGLDRSSIVDAPSVRPLRYRTRVATSAALPAPWHRPAQPSETRRASCGWPPRPAPPPAAVAWLRGGCLSRST